ncbi:MAG: FAD-dependent monooxygenase [Taibaiella sp.]|nr:FAD-dependent monooxygenase [Taibaiella sp.]
MENKYVLISGAGIAGTALAYWVKRFGFNPTIVEVAPALRQGGYAIDFWGSGFEVSDRMGIVPALSRADLGISEVSFVDADNRRKAAMNYAKLKQMMNGRAFTLLRSDLARIIYEHLDDDIDIIFGDTVTGIVQHSDRVAVQFRNSKTRDFDLVIGADGLHSVVRNLVFGDEARYEKFYGFYTASFTVKHNFSNGKEFLIYNVPGKQAAIYSIDENTSAAFFIFAVEGKLAYDHHDLAAQKQLLRDEFAGVGWKCADILARMDDAPDFYFDVVSQVQMDNWSQDRVSLVGDACDCPSLLSGQGSTLAIVGAYILAGELKNANGNYRQAFAEYQRIFKPFLDEKQRLARNFAASLVPKSSFGIWLRNKTVNLMFLPFVSKLFIKQFLDHKLELKKY